MQNVPQCSWSSAVKDLRGEGQKYVLNAPLSNNGKERKHEYRSIITGIVEIRDCTTGARNEGNAHHGQMYTNSKLVNDCRERASIKRPWWR